MSVSPPQAGAEGGIRVAKRPYRVLLLTQNSHITEREFARRLQLAGVDLRFVVDPGYTELEELRREGIDVFPLALHRRFDLAAIKALRATVRDGRFDVVHALANRPLTNALAAVIGTPAKLVAYRGAIGHVHRWDPGSWIKWLNPRIDRIVCVSDGVRRDLLSAGVSGEKLIRIYKGHDLLWYDRLPNADLQQLGIPRDAFVIGCVANMRRVKGIDVLLEALLRLPSDAAPHLLLIGEVRDRRIGRLARHPRLRGRVHLAGFRSDAPALIGACDLAVMPSRGREGLTKGIIEAMAQGVPAVVTSVGGLPELVVDGESGFVVAPGDPDALAAGIARLLTDAALLKRFGQSAKRRIASHFSIDVTVQETIAMYDALLELPPAPTEYPKQ